MAEFNIILAFSDMGVAQRIKTILASEGIYTTGTANSVSRAIILSKSFKGKGLVITQSKLPDGTCAGIIDNIALDYHSLILAKGDMSYVTNGKNASVLPLPIKKEDLIDTVKMFLSKSVDVSGKQLKNNKERKVRSPEENMLIEEAKALLIERNNFTEERAHRFLQKKSMDSGMALHRVALSILERW